MSHEALGRVLCLTSNFPRWDGDSTTPFVQHLAQDLQDLGWSVDVLAPHAPGAAAVETLAGIRVARFRYLWPERLETLCYGGGALANLRRHPAEAIKLPALVLSEWANLVKRLGRGRYDLLHSHWILPQGFAGVLAAGPRRIPHVASVHGSDVLTLKGPVVDMFKTFVLRRADAVTVNSSATRHAALRLAPDIQRLNTIPMGVSASGEPDAAKVSALRARYRRASGPLLVFAGRIVREKGLEDLISAMKLLAQKLPQATALVVGEGHDRPALETAVAKAGLEARVTFTGWIAPEAVPDYLAAGDIFVGPSWFEGQGLVFAEAMLAGVPVIAADVGGVADTVRHEHSGLLVHARAPGEIAAAVERLSRDTGLARRLASAGQAQVRAHGLRSHTAQAFSDLFRNVLAAQVAGRGTPHPPQRQEVS